MKEGNLDQNSSFLPQELWEKIYESLLIADRIRSSLVCKTWLSIAAATPQPPPEPWLISVGSMDDYKAPENSPKFLSLSEKRFYNFNNATPQDCKILGASNGWVLFECIGPKKPVFLVNPMLNAEIKFPSLDYDQIEKRVKKVLVVLTSSTARNHSDIPIGVIILGKGKTTPFFYYIACITCEDPTWHYQRFGPEVHDIVLHDRKLYVIAIWRWVTPCVFTCILDEHLKLLFVNHYDVEGIDFNSDRRSHSDRGVYLVKCHGDLLVLKRKSSNCGFEVFKLAMDEATTWRSVKLRDLGDQALFLGCDGCLALPVRKGEGLFQEGTFEENHIYFNVESESGDYSLEFGTVKTISNLPCSWWCRTTAWFVPTTKEAIVD